MTTRANANSQMNLINTISSGCYSAVERTRKSSWICSQLLGTKGSIRSKNFNAISATDLQVLFELVDGEFFHGHVSDCLKQRRQPIRFRLSSRMTSTGGMTLSTADQDRAEPTRFEIVISSTLLFESFRDQQPILVTGMICENRLHALQRIMEHEMIHLIEMLIWNNSSCSARRFQKIARRFFGHRQSTHELITPADTARHRHDIKPGDQVSFVLDNQRYQGFVNRITRRATVLVRADSGSLFEDGNRYRKYYVPIEKLNKISAV